MEPLRPSDHYDSETPASTGIAQPKLDAVGWLRFAFNNTDFWGDPGGIFNSGKWGSDPAYVEWRV